MALEGIDYGDGSVSHLKSEHSMDLRDHLRITGTALQRWFIAQSYDALIVGVPRIRTFWDQFWSAAA